MTKSNVRAVRRRRTNERIAHQYDQVQQAKVRAYQERAIEKRETMVAKRSSLFSKAVNYVRRALRSFVRFLRPNYSSIRGLDLRDGGLFGETRKRDAGAQQLRAWFGTNLKMVSTRDGRPV